MTSIPVDIVNYICEFAACNDKIWYPFFSPKTHKLSWKVNPYCFKYHQLARKFLNEIKIVPLVFYNVRTFEEQDLLCRVIRFAQPESFIDKLYMEFDVDEDNKDCFVARAMVVVFNNGINKDEMLYLNGTPYANINFGWAHLKIWPKLWSVRERITIGYETY